MSTKDAHPIIKKPGSRGDFELFALLLRIRSMSLLNIRRVIVLFSSFLIAPSASALSFSGLDEPTAIIWVAVSAALVFLMQAGFAMLESGMCRSKNAVNVIMKNFTDVSTGVLIYWLVGFGLMFGNNESGWLGLSLFAPGGLSSGDAVFLVFQAMFAATAATIVSGAVAERMKFGSYVLIAIVISGFIYPVAGSWVWGGIQNGTGWLAQYGFHDFAGGTVVHALGGWCALAAIVVLGPRRGRFTRSGVVRSVPGHNLTLVAIGVFLLWFGWFGFNGGSVIDDFSLLGRVLLNTQLGASAGVVGALLWMMVFRQPILMTHTLNGALGGLVSMTAGADVLAPLSAVAVGLVAGTIVVWGWNLLLRFGYDDVVGAVPVHAFCGVWGTIALAVLPGTVAFSVEYLLVQVIGAAAIMVWGFGISWVVFRLVAMWLGVRVPSIHEQRGLDYTEHSELGYPEFQDTYTHDGLQEHGNKS
jgi:Amt family ammonium transporter